jgi:calcineurin-like phosphoesterase
MVGPRDSVIGVQVEPVLQHFLTCMPARFDVAEGPVTFNAVLIVVDDVSGRAASIQRVDRLL